MRAKANKREKAYSQIEEASDVFELVVSSAVNFVQSVKTSQRIANAPTLLCEVR